MLHTQRSSSGHQPPLQFLAGLRSCIEFSLATVPEVLDHPMWTNLATGCDTSDSGSRCLISLVHMVLCSRNSVKHALTCVSALSGARPWSAGFFLLFGFVTMIGTMMGHTESFLANWQPWARPETVDTIL
jgi:hypothetical protein